jgi:hypothetical protein
MGRKMMCVAIIMLLIVQSGIVVQNGRAAKAVKLNRENTQIVAEAMEKEGFQTNILGTGDIGLIRDGIDMEILLFKGEAGMIVAKYFFKEEYACTVALVPKGDELNVTVSGGGDSHYYWWTLTNMPVLIGPEGLGVWSGEAIQKIASGLAKVAEVVLEQSYIKSILYKDVVYVPLEEVLHVFIGCVLEVQNRGAESSKDNREMTMIIARSMEKEGFQTDILSTDDIKLIRDGLNISSTGDIGLKRDGKNMEIVLSRKETGTIVVYYFLKSYSPAR